jgi:glycosyltransferase involved in cell wall biosynthesis
MKLIKVVHLTSVHGALDNRIFHKECRSLARAGFDVTIIAPHTENFVADQIHIRAIPRESGRVARMTRTVWRVYREALRQNADVYHFHDPELIPAGLLLRASGKKVIYDIHEDLPKDILSKFYLPEWSRRVISWFAGRIETAACGHFSALVPVTPSIARRFYPLNARTVIVHNYPYPEEIAAAAAASPWRERERSVAYVGGITAQRGIREMIHAISLVPARLNATLELAGNEIPAHADPDTLRRHPGWQRVRYQGIVDGSGVALILSRVRAGLVLFHPKPNHWEAMPQKMFEYMGAGLPIIASDFPLWREIIDGIGCGVLVDPLDPRAIAGAIDFILTHPDDAEAMGRRGQAAVLSHYNWETQAKKLIDLYSGLLEPVCAE